MIFFHGLVTGDFFVNTGVSAPVSILMKTGAEHARLVRYCKRKKTIIYGKEVSVASHMTIESINKSSITG